MRYFNNRIDILDVSRLLFIKFFDELFLILLLLLMSIWFLSSDVMWLKHLIENRKFFILMKYWRIRRFQPTVLYWIFDSWKLVSVFEWVVWSNRDENTSFDLLYIEALLTIWLFSIIIIGNIVIVWLLLFVIIVFGKIDVITQTDWGRKTPDVRDIRY